MLCYFLSQVVRTPTLADSILDLVLCNQKDLVKEVVVGPHLGANNHSIVQFKIQLPKSLETPLLFKRNFKRADLGEIQSYFMDIDWYGMTNTASSVNDKYEIFISIIHHCIEIFVPREEVPVRRCSHLT